MKATLLYIKEKDNNSRMWASLQALLFLFLNSCWFMINLCTCKKTLIIDESNNDSLFFLFDHFISLVVYDNSFEATFAKNVKNMFWVKISLGKKSLTLKWKRRVLDLLVFREPLRSVDEVGTLPARGSATSSNLDGRPASNILLPSMGSDVASWMFSTVRLPLDPSFPFAHTRMGRSICLPPYEHFLCHCGGRWRSSRRAQHSTFFD
jgi:hypothetical protein